MTPINDNKARMSYLPDLNDYEKDIFTDDEEDEERGPEEEIQSWDVFKYFPPKLKTGSKANTGFIDGTLKVVKVFVYAILFFFILCGGIIAKIAIIYAASQIDNNGPVNYCDYNDAEQRPGGKKLSATVPEISRIAWYWCIFGAFSLPEVLGLLNAGYRCLFKKRVSPKQWDIVFSLVIDGLHTIGLAVLVLFVIPQLNSVQAVIVSSCTCVVPGLLGVLPHDEDRSDREKSLLVIIGDVAAFSVQICGALVWLLPDGDARSTSASWLVPITLILTSCRWWTNYVSPHSRFRFIRTLSHIKERLEASRGTTMAYTSIFRIIIFLASLIAIARIKGIHPSELFDSAIFTGEHNITLNDLTRLSSPSLETDIFENTTYENDTVGYRTVRTLHLPLIVFLVQGVSAFVVYSAGKFACRTLMQRFGFACPSSLVVPGCIATMVICCALRDHDKCMFHGFLPDYMFFNVPGDIDSLADFLRHWYPWIWPLTLLSQAWITRHIWSPRSERLAATERLFVVPTYDSLIIDQSIMLNRRIDEDILEDDATAKHEEAAEEEKRAPVDGNYIGVEKSDSVTRVIVCATMWHENREEMTEFVESILRLDAAQGTKRIGQKYYNVELRDYYELETHVFFDDAFCCMHGCERRCKHDENETQVNDYVMCLMETMVKTVESKQIRATPPMKYPAPYGGRLEWTLPGKTSMIVHLKDKNKIRHRKRWSQVMYMYYLLGYRLMDRPITRQRKVTIAENTYLLTLDGDIDFRPSAVKVLLDLMKRDKDLGAACGRIHPVGTGPMVWFQKFEYAIGHWLQKSTEHTIGSVLCSPGCFSLFRARALMEHNVMRKYAIQATEPRHYVQYDQGEDRWLCTLILQVGYRVEYSAASDSYTHAPESFQEFYNQRRRWIPSTIANIFDLLSTADETRKVNDDISWLYIFYQWVLMGSTVLGPGTIFLMMVGAFVAAFPIDNWDSFGYNLIPIAIFVIVCFTCKANVQLIVAGIISAFYGLVMVVVLIGIMIQIAEDGWVAPSTILFFVVASQLVIAGLLHPLEWSCLLCGLIYYVTVPSMYMILIIFSLFNVNNVTWGTRDSGTPTEGPEDVDPKAAQPKNEKTEAKKNIDSAKVKERSSIELFADRLFKCMLCARDTSSDEDLKFKVLTASLDRIASRLDAMEKNSDGNEAPKNYRNENKPPGKFNDLDKLEPVVGASAAHSQSAEYFDGSDENDDEDGDEVSEHESDYSCTNGSSRDTRDFLVSPYWLQDERLRKGGVEFLSSDEETFWERLIGKYLFPIDEDEKQMEETAKGLVQLRDEYLFKFFMVNALYVLIVFLMQLNKDILHIVWPLGATYNITFVSTDMEVHLGKNSLSLEPIGCLFIVGFVVILGVQFIAMLFHRWDTFAHLLANTNIDWCASKRNGDQSVEDELKKLAEDLADDLERAVEHNAALGLAHRTSTVAPGKRNTVHQLVDSQDNRTKYPASIDAVFRKNLNDPRSEISRLMSTRMPPKIFEALEQRRSTIRPDPKSSTVHRYESDNIYHRPDDVSARNQQQSSAPLENSRTYDNRAFVSDDSNDDLPGNNVIVPHRPSHVKFG